MYMDTNPSRYLSQPKMRIWFVLYNSYLEYNYNTHRIHVWYIYLLHLPQESIRCRYGIQLEFMSATSLFGVFNPLEKNILVKLDHFL